MQLTDISPTNDYIKRWHTLKTTYIQARGQFKANGAVIPKTTTHDVSQLLDYWQGEYERSKSWLAELPAIGDWLDQGWRQDRAASAQEAWERAALVLERELPGLDEHAEYPNNGWFWQETRKLALYLESLDLQPSALSLAIDAVDEVVSEYVDAAAETIDSTKSTLRRTLFIGGAVLGGVVGTAALVRFSPRWKRQREEDRR